MYKIIHKNNGNTVIYSTKEKKEVEVRPDGIVIIRKRKDK